MSRTRRRTALPITIPPTLPRSPSTASSTTAWKKTRSACWRPSTPRSRESTTAPWGSVGRAASRSARNASRRCPGPPSASTASARRSGAEPALATAFSGRAGCAGASVCTDRSTGRRSEGGPVTEPASRTLDVRVGSSTDALTPVSVAERSLAAQAQQWAGLGAVVLAAIAADQLTKLIVASELTLDEGLHVLGPFSIHHVQNSGIAFGLFASATPVVTALTALAVGWMLLFFARSGSRHPVLPVALGLLIGGSTSNLIDRIRLGHVTDFLDLRYWPAFNLADSFIVVGVGILFVALLLGETRQR